MSKRYRHDPGIIHIEKNTSVYIRHRLQDRMRGYREHWTYMYKIFEDIEMYRDIPKISMNNRWF